MTNCRVSLRKSEGFFLKNYIFFWFSFHQNVSMIIEVYQNVQALSSLYRHCHHFTVDISKLHMYTHDRAYNFLILTIKVTTAPVKLMTAPVNFSQDLQSMLPQSC